MTAAPRNIIPSAYVGTSAANEYTASNVRTVVQNMTLTNVSSASTAVTVHLVPSGGTAGTSNTIIDARNLQASEVYDCPEVAGKVLDDGDSIAVKASDASAVVCNASGVEFAL